ncbi:TonB-dependent receptor plug domain-containing protein [Sandarakinorhabdus sp.]|uniref:TonB-dependent receptor plug domain-containing protein n=1 Tax=Sandarakinorhabdus sp. TaxID=1916663 RepID=UPI003F7091AF
MSTLRLRSGCALVALIAGTFYGATAHAQAAQTVAQNNAADDPADAEIVVTGSFIRGTREDAAVPIDVFTADDLNKQGITSPLDFIKQLPGVGASLGDTNQFSTSSQGFQGNGSINLRALGPTRTLVLFNGRRTVLAPGDGFADTNLIPIFALSSIEILKDGAAATYGSDAIAGVANFVTRRDFNGAIIQGDFSAIRGSRGNWTMSALVGQTFGKVNLMVGGGWQHRSTLPSFSRDFSRTPYQVNPSAWSVLSTPGTFLPFYNGAPTGLVRDGGTAGCSAVGGINDTTGPNNTGLPICRFSFLPWNNIIEEEDRYQGYAQMDIDVSDRTKLHFEFTYAQTDTTVGQSPSFPPTQGPRGSGSANAFTVSPNNPGVPAFLAQNGLLPSTAERPLTGINAVLWRPFGWLGNLSEPVRGAGLGSAENKSYRLSGGLEQEFTDNFRAQFYGTWWRSERDAFARDMVGSRLQNALNGLGGPNCNVAANTPGQNGCQWFNPFLNANQPVSIQNLTNPNYVPGAENSAELINFIQVNNGTRQVEEQFVADAIFSGETAIDLGGGPIAYAFGAQYRRNEWSTRPLRPESDLSINPCFREGDRSCVGTPIEGVGSFIFLGGSRPEQVTQSVKALFAEVKIPVTDTLEVTGAARFEDYGGSVGSTFNPKGSVRWNPTDWLVLRGSLGTTFRGPLANQVVPNQVTTLAGLQAAANNFKSVDIFGNPNDLGPETAFTYNVGAVIKTSGITFSADYWGFDVKDRVTTTPGQAIATSVASGALAPNNTRFANCSSVFANLVTFQGGCVQGVTTGLDISRVRTDWVNGPGLKTSGIDLSLDYNTDLGRGKLNVGAQASIVLDYTFDDFVFRGVLVQAGYQAKGFTNYFRDPLTVSPLRGSGWINYAIDGFNARYQVRYVGGVDDDRCVGLANCASTNFGPTNFGAVVQSFTQHDINFLYDIPIGGLTTQLQFSIDNFTDQAPPASRLELSYDPFIGNGLGRVFRFGIRVIM